MSATGDFTLAISNNATVVPGLITLIL